MALLLVVFRVSKFSYGIMEKEGNGFFEDFADAEMVPLASEQARPG